MLALDAIDSGYGDALVLRDVDLTVGQGEVIALLGPNGAGKSTLLRTATGFVKPMSGRIEVDGEDLTGSPAHRFVRRGVCLLPEGRGIFPSLTVLENIRVQAGPKPGRRLAELLDEIAELFPVLRERLHQTAGDLSGGEQQMLALCRAYMTRPRVVLVDEASLGLAPLVVDAIYEALARLAERGVSLVIVEQYVQRVLELASRVYILSGGQVVHVAAADQIEPDEIYERYLGVERAS
ncbi:MAG: ABC transporter ATP-binding protein [Acidimicrobiia bacterium]